jgi:hypothetical protein
MTAIRQHDVTIAEGTFSLVLTKERRLVAAIHAPLTPLGPLHLAFEMDRGIHPDLLHRYALANRGLAPRQIAVGGIFDDIGHFVSKAAEGAFNSASKVITTITRPVFSVTRDAVSHVMKGIAQITPFLPEHLRHDIGNAARIVARARLGDVTAKQFIHTIGQAAKAGVAAARKIGDALLDGTKLVAHVIDLPVHLLKHVPGVGDVVTSISPFQKFEHMVAAVQRGDFRALKKMITDDLHTFQGVASLIPGLGTGISSGLSAGLAALDGGSPIEIAVNAAYGAIPIPVGIRTVTDSVLAAVMELVKNGNITDVVLAVARDRVPSGFPRDIFDTLARIVVKKVPIKKAAGALAGHYIDRYIGKPAAHLLDQGAQQLGNAAHFAKAFDPKIMGTIDPRLLEMSRRALSVGGQWPNMDAWGLPGRTVIIGGEEPVAYAVGGEEPVAYAVGGEEPVAHFEVGAEFIVGGVSTDLLAKLPAASEWLSNRHHGG